MAPRKPTTIERIETDATFAREFQVLQTLQHGRDAIDAEIRALRIEDFLSKPSTPRADREGRSKGNVLRLNSRTAGLEARLRAHRAKVPAEAEAVASSASVSIDAALKIILGTRPPIRLSRQKLIEQLQTDLDVVREAFVEQQGVVDRLRDELSAALAQRLVQTHRDLVLAQFRAAQALAHTTDLEAEFRKSVIDAGFAWRADLFQGPLLRGALVLGSEATFDSDISRARRMLEEMKIL